MRSSMRGVQSALSALGLSRMTTPTRPSVPAVSTLTYSRVYMGRVERKRKWDREAERGAQRGEARADRARLDNTRRAMVTRKNELDD